MDFIYRKNSERKLILTIKTNYKNMKKTAIFLLCSLTLFYCKKKEEGYKGHPVVKASTTATNIKIGEQWFNNGWNINPKATIDTLNIPCILDEEEFVVATDKDTISFKVSDKKFFTFYIQLNDTIYKQAVATGIPLGKSDIAHNATKKNDSISIVYNKNNDNDYLKELAVKYPILPAIKNTTTDKEKLLGILNWTNSRWKHSGNQVPSKSDAITILDEAKAGGRFPCFAYAIVLKSQLENAGFRARTVYLKTKDVETRKTSPGHVATEVYSNEYNKWVFLDGQFNIMPVLNGTPLNAVEFQQALTHNYNELEAQSLGDVSKREYTYFVYDYLYYFDTSLDHRNSIDKTKKHRINKKESLMLVPNGAKNPTYIPFWKSNIDYCVYTNNLNDFYAKP